MCRRCKGSIRTDVDVGAHLSKFDCTKDGDSYTMYFDSSFILCSLSPHPQHEPNQLKIILGTTASAWLWHVINFLFSLLFLCSSPLVQISCSLFHFNFFFVIYSACLFPPVSRFEKSVSSPVTILSLFFFSILSFALNISFDFQTKDSPP